MIKIQKDGQTLSVTYGVYKNTFAGLGYTIVKEHCEKPVEAKVEAKVEEVIEKPENKPAEKQVSKGGKHVIQNRK